MSKSTAVEDEIAPVPERAEEQTRREKAAEFLASHEDTSFTYEEEKAVLRRVDCRILPLLLGAYFFQQLDKSTLSYTSVFDIVSGAHLVGNEYSWLGSVLYLAQLVMQPAMAFLLVKFPNGKVLSSAILCWGAALSIMTACTSFHSLLGMRFVLGCFEAMIAPCCVAFTQTWWRRSEQTMRTSYWSAMNGVTLMIGSLFTYGLGHIDSANMFKYQIIFLFCGLLTVAYSFVVFILVPDSPMEAKFLTDRERVIATERLRANQMGITSRKWRWDHVWETATDVKTYLWFIAVTSISIASGGITTFGSLIVKSFGYSSFTTILFNIPFGAIQLISILGTAWFAKRFQCKGLVIAFNSVLPSIGAIIMLTVSRKNKGVLLFGYYLVSCLASITPLIFNWSSSNTAGDTKKKCTSAVVFIGMCVGNVIGPLLYSTDQAPLYRKGLIADLCMFVVVGVVSGLIPIYLKYLNRRHAARRQQLGKSVAIIDESMASGANKDKLEESRKAVEVEDVREAEKGARDVNGAAAGPGAQHRSLEEDNALHDVTDLKNEDFIYVY
ncbi:major facilitator superfamily domain-containing protein [Coniella lustricola]|uniref:Major facilitator superfamily domain-containing protein n=1 Tax=Coniella lustricola TaxID=2025994 RepID=A0A2T3A726_9PEZI|nr:major facilitator superfamily domain-containing protein [Coniella lustricola]